MSAILLHTKRKFNGEKKHLFEVENIYGDFTFKYIHVV